MFLGLNPEIAIVNNLEHDHPDHYPTVESLVEVFQQFITNIQPNGLLIAGVDSPLVAELAKDYPNTVSYGLNHAEWVAKDIQNPKAGHTKFSVYHHDSLVDTVTLPMMGQHNVQNSLAVIAVAHHLGVDFPTISRGLSTFAGTGRRSEILGTVANVTVVSDYAHHPTAVDLTLNSWQQTKGNLWAVWQPHMYTRLRAMADEFAHAFSAADKVLITDVYSVREEITEGLASPNLAKMVQQTGHTDTRYSGNFEQTAAILSQEVQSGDTVIILSAGDAPKIGHLLLEALAENDNL